MSDAETAVQFKLREAAKREADHDELVRMGMQLKAGLEVQGELLAQVADLQKFRIVVEERIKLKDQTESKQLATHGIRTGDWMVVATVLVGILTVVISHFWK